MKKRGLVKQFVLLVFFLILFAGLSNFVSANVAIISPVNGGNYTAIMNISILSTDPQTNSTLMSFNVTLYCNKSGGSVYLRLAGDKISTIWNATQNTTIFENATFRISSLTEALRMYNCSAYADNGSVLDAKWSVAIKNITIDNTPPNVTFSGITNTINNGNYSGIIMLNVSANDTTMGVGNVYFNITDSNGIQINFSKASVSGSYYNLTVDTSVFLDGKYNVTVYANDTVLNNLNKTEWIQIVMENTGPIVTFSCSPSAVNIGYPITCSCSGTAASEVNSTTFTASPSTDSAGTFTTSCTVTSYFGKSTSANATYTVSHSGGGTTTGGSGGVTAVNSWTKITPGVAAIIKDFNKDLCVKQIQIEVNNEAQNVKITINKYDSKPANVSVEKSDTYKYLSIVTQNLKDNLSRAVIEIQVNKSWVSDKNFNKTDIALFRYNEAANKWEELTTTFKEEDSTYYYYDAELTSFSYFAIAPKEQALVVEEQQETTLGEEQEGTLSVWVGIIIAFVILAGFVAFFILKKNKKKIK